MAPTHLRHGQDLVGHDAVEYRARDDLGPDRLLLERGEADVEPRVADNLAQVDEAILDGDEAD